MISLAYDNIAQRADLVRASGANLTTDEGLETAVTISLFTDARATVEDDVPEGADLRGWWGARYLDSTERELGSKLWLLHRQKVSEETINQAVALAREALNWMVDDGVASDVRVTATKLRANILVLTVEIQRPRAAAKRWRNTWEVQLAL